MRRRGSGPGSIFLSIMQPSRVKGDWREVDHEAFSRQLDNATGYFHLARLTRSHAVEKKRPASIILVGSTYGMVGPYPKDFEGIRHATAPAYHALKGGIINLTRYLAVSWAPDNIRVNCLSPGPFPKPDFPDELRERYHKRVPMGRMGSPHELKGAVPCSSQVRQAVISPVPTSSSMGDGPRGNDGVDGGHRS